MKGRQTTPELAALVDDAREGRAALRAALANLDASQMDALLRTLVVGDAVSACEPPLDLDRPIDALCEQALVARGPFDQGPVRTMLRERARIHLRLNENERASRAATRLLKARFGLCPTITGPWNISSQASRAV